MISHMKLVPGRALIQVNFEIGPKIGTGGLTIFMLSNDTHSPVGLCGGSAALFLVIYTVPEQITN